MIKKTKTIRQLEKNILEVSGITDDITKTIRQGFEINSQEIVSCSFLHKERYYFETMNKLGLIKEVEVTGTYHWFNLKPKAKRLYNKLKREGYFGKQ